MAAMSTKETRKLAEIAKLQSERSFDRGMKLTKQILNTNGSCAEAIAWKAYFTYMKDAKQATEAVELMKTANRTEMRNSKVWRIAGLMYKDMNDLPRYLQCLRQSVACDNSDITIINDMCTLNLYFGNYHQLVADCRMIVRRNATPYTIMRYAYALILNDSKKFACRVISDFQESWRAETPPQDIEFRSEVCLLQMQLLIDIGNWQECLDYAEKQATHIKDMELCRELQVECLMKLGKDPMPVVMELLKTYPENGDYFNYVEAVIPAASIVDKLIEMSTTLKSSYARVRALEIMNADDPRLRDLLSAQIEPLLMKGAPATFMTVQELNKPKLRIALEIARATKVPVVYVPIVHLFAAHVYGREGDFENALKEIDAGIAHTPTCIELIAWKARFMARAGRVKEAVVAAEKVWDADPADRNANLLAVKYLFLGGYRKKATDEAKAFAGKEGDKELIFDTQFNAFYLKNGFACLRAGDIDFAKQLYNGIMEHFVAYRQNQFCYIGWAWKMPRALLDVVEEMNTFEKCPLFSKAVEFAIQIALLEGKLDEMKDLALRGMKSGQPAAMAYACVVFGHLGMRLQALKCFMALKGNPMAFIASPTMKAIVSALDDGADAVVKAVITEEYEPLECEPKTFVEWFAAGRGFMAVGDVTAAENMFIKAVDVETLPFKQALQLYVYATALSGNDTIKSKISSALTTKYPSFEFQLECTEEYEATMA